MGIYYFEKPLMFQKKKPIPIYNNEEEVIGEITKAAAQIAFSKKQDIYTYHASNNTENASVTLEIGWLGTEGATVVFHNLEDSSTIAFQEELGNMEEALSISGEWEGSSKKILISQITKEDPLVIYADDKEIAKIDQTNDKMKKFISIETADKDPSLPVSLFILCYFIQKLLKEEF